MSIVLAVKKNDKIVIAADSQTSFGSQMLLENHVGSKIIRTPSGIFIGFAGWGIYNSLLRVHLERNEIIADNELQVFEFFIKFWKSLRENFHLINDRSSSDTSPFAELDSTFLVVTRENIFYIADDISVCEFSKYYAIGSGCEVALGALSILYEREESVEVIATSAVNTAIGLDNGCGGDVYLDTIK